MKQKFVPTSNFKGVLFDFDGTLARTMEDHYRSWQAVLAAYGAHLKPEDYFPLEGSSVHELARMFVKWPAAEQAKLSGLEPKELVHQKEQHYLKNHRFTLYPGVLELVAALKEFRVPIGIVTAALHDRLYKSTPVDFLDHFDCVITGEKTAKGKPHPDPYLKGADELGLKPEECLVVENAPLGVKAAKQAQAYCVAVCSTLAPSYFAEADEVVPAFSDLSGLGVFRALLQGAAELNPSA